MKFIKQLIYVVVAVSIFPVHVLAISNEQKAVFDSGVDFFNVEDNFCTSTPELLPANANLDTASLEKIRQLTPVYKKHADRMGFPWQILAAKHYRETGLGLYNPPNGQGIWQLYSLVSSGQQYFPPAETISIEEFDRQTGIMVDWFFTGDKLTKAQNHSLVDLQYIFTTYNGWGDVAKTLSFYNAKRAGVTVDRQNSDELLNWNAYSMNQFDAQRTDMIAKISDASISVAEAEAAAQKLIDTGSSGDPRIGTNKAIGAVSIYSRLGGPFNSGGQAVVASTTAIPDNIKKMYVIGDSLTVGMREYLTANIGDALASPIEATTGISIQDSIPKVDFPADTDTVIVGLGTNNFADSADTFLGHVNDMVEKIRSINPEASIYWVNIYAPREDIASKVAELNGVLSSIQQNNTKFSVIDWATEAQNGGYTFPDELHPAETTKRADFILKSVSIFTNQSSSNANICTGSGNGGAVAGSITQTALNFSWTEAAKVDQIRAVKNSGDAYCSMRDNPGSCGQISRDAGALIGEADAKPEYVEAVKQYNKGNDSDGSNWAFSDCGVFVATVMRASGADPEYAARGTGTQISYVKSSSKYTVIPFTDTSLLRPGDVLIKDGHTRVYVGTGATNPINDIAEASWGNHVPTVLAKVSVGYSNPNDTSSSPYIIARLK